MEMAARIAIGQIIISVRAKVISRKVFLIVYYFLEIVFNLEILFIFYYFMIIRIRTGI